MFFFFFCYSTRSRSISASAVCIYPSYYSFQSGACTSWQSLLLNQKVTITAVTSISTLTFTIPKPNRHEVPRSSPTIITTLFVSSHHLTALRHEANVETQRTKKKYYASQRINEMTSLMQKRNQRKGHQIVNT